MGPRLVGKGGEHSGAEERISRERPGATGCITRHNTATCCLLSDRRCIQKKNSPEGKDGCKKNYWRAILSPGPPSGRQSWPAVAIGEGLFQCITPPRQHYYSAVSRDRGQITVAKSGTTSPRPKIAPRTPKKGLVALLNDEAARTDNVAHKDRCKRGTQIAGERGKGANCLKAVIDILVDGRPNTTPAWVVHLSKA